MTTMIEIKKERNSLSKHRPGPISLNVGLRRRQISEINSENKILSKKLNTQKCTIPDLKSTIAF